jgi:hypothetical protein
MSYLDAALKVKLPVQEAGDVIPIRPGLKQTTDPDQFQKPYLDAQGDPVIPFDSDPRYHHWAGGQSLDATTRELWEERAAIREFEGGQTREEAERGALEDIQRIQARRTLGKAKPC